MKNLATKTFVHGRSRRIQNLALAGITAAVLSACGGGSGGCCTVPPSGNSQLIFVAPSILPSLANKTGINYMGVYNPSDVAISGIKYSVGQQVGSGNSITMDQASALACANIAAKSSCYLKFSVPESTIAGGTVVSAIDSNGVEAATPLAIGVQQVPYSESANANGVGLYFYPKAQYSESSVPFILVTAVVQSPNVGTINTIELVDESGNVIPNQAVTSKNSGPGSSPLQMGDVVEIELPLPQGVNLTQNIKVQTSYQTLATSALSSIADKLDLKNIATKATSNKSTGNQVYTVTTQGSNINLQFTPNQVYLTQKDPVQYGYLYNIGDLTASQITVTSSSPNVRVTAADAILNGERVIKVTYELINTSVAPTTNMVLVTGTNPSGQTQTSTGGTSQNVNPDVVPTPSPAPTPTPTPTPTPVPPPTPILPQLTASTNPSNLVVAGGACSSVSASIPEAVPNPVTVTFTVAPVSASSYGFGSGPNGAPFGTTTSCTINNPDTTCYTQDGGDLCAATGTGGTEFTITASATGYQDGSVPVTIAYPPLTIYYAHNGTSGYDGNLGGVAGADAKCNADPDKPATPVGATYKAVLVDGTDPEIARVACTTANCTTPSGSWVLYPDTPYINASGETLGTTNSAGIFTSTLQNIIAPPVFQVQYAFNMVWTGLATGWVTATGPEVSCSGWTTNAINPTGSYGDTSGTSPGGQGGAFYGNGSTSCRNKEFNQMGIIGIYCAEQR
jgi:hypothetical protein